MGNRNAGTKQRNAGPGTMIKINKWKNAKDAFHEKEKERSEAKKRTKEEEIEKEGRHCGWDAEKMLKERKSRTAGFEPTTAAPSKNESHRWQHLRDTVRHWRVLHWSQESHNHEGDIKKVVWMSRASQPSPRRRIWLRCYHLWLSFLLGAAVVGSNPAARLFLSCKGCCCKNLLYKR